jgi:hypothetical protein
VILGSDFSQERKPHSNILNLPQKYSHTIFRYGLLFWWKPVRTATGVKVTMKSVLAAFFSFSAVMVRCIGRGSTRSILIPSTSAVHYDLIKIYTGCVGLTTLPPSEPIV